MRSPIMKFFAFSHLPQHLQEISAPFAALAEQVDLYPAGNEAARDEKATALRKLLEAKDAAVRAFVTVFVLLLALAVLLAPTVAFAQAPDAGATAAPDPLLLGLGELVTHAKLGRTVLAIVIGVKLAIEILRRFGRMLPGAVGLWFVSPMAAWVLPLAAGVVGGLATTLANGGGVVDGLVGGVLVGIGAWLPTPGAKPAEPSPKVETTGDAVRAFNAATEKKGPNP